MATKEVIEWHTTAKRNLPKKKHLNPCEHTVGVLLKAKLPECPDETPVVVPGFYNVADDVFNYINKLDVVPTEVPKDNIIGWCFTPIGPKK